MEQRIATVSSSHARNAVLELEGALRVGDHIHVVAQGEEKWAEVLALEANGLEAEKAGAGQTVEATLDRAVPDGGTVYRLDALEAHEGDDDLRLSMPPGGPDDPIPDQEPAL